VELGSRTGLDGAIAPAGRFVPSSSKDTGLPETTLRQRSRDCRGIRLAFSVRRVLRSRGVRLAARPERLRRPCRRSLAL